MTERADHIIPYFVLIYLISLVCSQRRHYGIIYQTKILDISNWQVCLQMIKCLQATSRERETSDQMKQTSYLYKDVHTCISNIHQRKVNHDSRCLSSISHSMEATACLLAVQYKCPIRTKHGMCDVYWQLQSLHLKNLFNPIDLQQT